MGHWILLFTKDTFNKKEFILQNLFSHLETLIFLKLVLNKVCISISFCYNMLYRNKYNFVI